MIPVNHTPVGPFVVVENQEIGIVDPAICTRKIQQSQLSHRLLAAMAVRRPALTGYHRPNPTTKIHHEPRIGSNLDVIPDGEIVPSDAIEDVSHLLHRSPPAKRIRKSRSGKIPPPLHHFDEAVE